MKPSPANAKRMSDSLSKSDEARQARLPRQARHSPERAGAGQVRVGPAGWSYPDWEGIVYPAHKPKAFHEAAYLSQFFDTIEINTSFYQPLRAPLAMKRLGVADILRV